MKIFPEGSTRTPDGLKREAANADPPSPENNALWLPATVVIVPSVLTMRIRLLLESAM